MNTIRVAGVAGSLRWSYREAAALGSWSMEHVGLSLTLTAHVVSLDAFAVSQRPLTFRVTRESGVVWSWPVESLQVVDNALTATLRSEE